MKESLLYPRKQTFCERTELVCYVPIADIDLTRSVRALARQDILVCVIEQEQFRRQARICGPGDIEQAHVADELVETAQLEAC